MSGVRVVLAHHHLLFREVVRDKLTREPGTDVVGDASSAEEVIDAVGALEPDVVVFYAGIGGLHPDVTVVCLKAASPQTNVLVLDDEASLDRLANVLDAGATGYMTNFSSIPDLVEAIRMVARGETLLPRDMLGGLLEHLEARRSRYEVAVGVIGALSRREREVLNLLVDGVGNSDIAERLVISPQTARTHVQKVMKKLGVHSRLEATSFVRNNGIAMELSLAV